MKPTRKHIGLRVRLRGEWDYGTEEHVIRIIDIGPGISGPWVECLEQPLAVSGWWRIRRDRCRVLEVLETLSGEDAHA